MNARAPRSWGVHLPAEAVVVVGLCGRCLQKTHIGRRTLAGPLMLRLPAIKLGSEEGRERSGDGGSMLNGAS